MGSLHHLVYPIRHKLVHKAIAALKRFEKRIPGTPYLIHGFLFRPRFACFQSAAGDFFHIFDIGLISKSSIVAIIKKNLLPSVAALGDVVWKAGYNNFGDSRYGIYCTLIDGQAAIIKYGVPVILIRKKTQKADGF